ncbi:MAG: hypothetical protein B7X08_07065 [Acidocella sp. 20-63-7]|nr:MAG: hypothetical protein B7X08_07065 [Acidocella sp. 20-63-7]HQT46342.1 DUF3253 domain-containing protein [Acidocella sp.]
MTSDPAEKAILSQLAAAGAHKSICPTEAARALAGNPPGDKWRASLSPIRLAAQRLAKAGRIEILRKGKPVALEDARGVIRLRLPISE